MQGMNGTQRGEACPGWFAIRTRPKHELAVANRLNAEGIETFWPTYSERVQWSDRERVAVRSLFPGYVFALFDRLEWPTNSAGILQILNEPVDHAQIQSIRKVIDARATVSPAPYVTGETVRVRRGPLSGCEGIIERVKNGRRLILRIDILQRAVAVELDAQIVKRRSPQGA
jgi:transcription antitermination factor NusG